MTTQYSREINTPRTKLEGLCNFVQMIINAVEAGNNRGALLIAVDLLSDLASTSNPYADVTDGKLAASRHIDALQQKHSKELSAAVKKAHEDGIAEGRRLQRQETAERLGLAA